MPVNFVFFQIHCSSLSVKLEEGNEKQVPIFLGINMSTSFCNSACCVSHSKDQC